ncbi:MAG TPA: histidine phosphatase family protein [Burkholderiales bacterium]|nr:histidine phosphatase family protein [Burkholderiales bacterium]
MLRALALVGLFLPAAAAAQDLWALLARGGQVVLVRHAETTPGTGDPPGFRLEDCTTQRNLSELGRAQARRLGDRFREHRVPVSRVLSSPWCRCIETAEHAFGVRPDTHPALGNLFGRAENRERQVAAFRELIAERPAQGNLVLVTHGSTTVALTGEHPAMGEAIVLMPLGAGNFRVAGRISP